VNTNPGTVEKKLGTKNTVKTRKKIAIIVKTDDEDGGTEQTRKGKKKRGSSPGKSASNSLSIFPMPKAFYRQFWR